MRSFFNVVLENLLGLAIFILTAAIFLILIGVYTSKKQDFNRVIDKELRRKATIAAESFLSGAQVPLDASLLQTQLNALVTQVPEIEIVFIAIPQNGKFQIISSSDSSKIGLVTSTPLMEKALSNNTQASVLEIRSEGSGNIPQKITQSFSLKQNRIFEGAFPIVQDNFTHGLLFLRFSFADIDSPLAASFQKERNQLLILSILLLPTMLFLGFWASKKTNESQKQQALIKQKDALLSFAAHELNTPLGYVKSVLSLLEKEQISLHGKELMARAQDSLQQLINLVEDLLMVSRLEAGRLEIYPRPIHIEEVINAIVPQFTKLAQDKNLSFTYTPPQVEIPKIVADPDKLREVITNFLSNAVKYTPKGGVTLRLYPERSWVNIAVQDTGLGISEEERKKLFTQFGRLEKTKSIKGTGLGLYITNLLVKAHNGKINVESVEGRGSTFIVSLPVPRSLPKEEPQTSQTKNGGTTKENTNN